MPNYLQSDLKIDSIHVNEAVEVVAADKTLTAGESGKTFSLQNATGEDIVLPALEAGLKYTFIVGAVFATTNWTVATATAAGVINGLATVAGALVAAAAEDSINFAFGAETIGDRVDVVCDGTSWLVVGWATATGGITFTT